MTSEIKLKRRYGNCENCFAYAYEYNFDTDEIKRPYCILGFKTKIKINNGFLELYPGEECYKPIRISQFKQCKKILNIS